MRSLNPEALTRSNMTLFSGNGINCGYRLDIVVEGQVIVEIKAVSDIAPIHEAQLLSYLKMSNYRKGLLINFNVQLLKDGIHRLKL